MSLRYFAPAQNAASRLVIRRIASNQVVSIVSASSAHPHFGAEHFQARHPEQFP